MRNRSIYLLCVLVICSLVCIMPVAGDPDNKLAIVATNPVGGTYGVPADISEITVTFNEPIYYDPTSSEYVQIFSYPVGQPESELPLGVISVRDSNTLVISAPQTPWLSGYMYYKVHIIHVRGMDGDWMPGAYYYDFNFKTASTDPAPTVVSTYPADGESNIPADVTITATMDESINICVGTVQMVDSKNNPVALLYSDQYFHSADHIHLEIKPVAPLILGEKYTVTIQGLDHQGIVMETPYSWSFTTITSGEATQDLTTKVDSLGLPAAVETGLMDKLTAAQARIAQKKYTPARNTLNAFINQVNAQTGKAIDPDDTDELIAIAQRIINSIPGK